MSVAIDATAARLDKDSYDEHFEVGDSACGEDEDAVDELEARIITCYWYTCGFTV